MPKEVKRFNLGLVGWPLKKTSSPAIFDFLFKKAKIKGHYLPIKLRPQDFSKTFLENCRFDGLNITSPHKQKAFVLSDVKTESAKKAMAANLLKKSGKKWISYNTDIPAFKKTLKERFESACVFGCGGAAAAILVALGELGVKKIYCVSSKGKKTLNSKILKAKYPQSKFYFIKQKKNAPLACLYVNARIPSAIFPEFPAQAANSLFYDLNYFGKNEFLSKASKLKAQIKTGEEMLFYQALYSFKILTGISIRESTAKKIIRRI